MKHIYLSTDDIGDSLRVVNGKVDVSENYLTVAQSDSKYQEAGAYATTEQLTNLDTKVDALVDVYQPLGNYITTEDADLKYLTAEGLVDYATKEYVDQAVANAGGGSGEPGTGGEGFNGNYVGNSKFTGDMEVTGELTVPSLYDKTGSRQILVSDIITTAELNDLLPGIGGGGTPSEYVLPVASAEVLGGVKVGTGLSIDENGILHNTITPGSGEGTPSDYVLPVATKSTLGGVIAGNNVDIDSAGVISVTFPTVEDVVIPIATTNSVGVVKIGNNISVSADGTISAQAGFTGTHTGDVTFNGNLNVNGNIVYTGEIMNANDMPPLEYTGLRCLFESGRFVQGTPVTAGDVTHNEDGTFTDGADYFGKLTQEGYLDLSVQNQVMTSLSNCNMLNTNCIAYAEIIGKLNTTNSIFATMVRQDKATGNTFSGTKNGSSTNSIGNAMTEGLNRILFVPTSGGKGKVFVNGQLVGTDGQYAMLQIVSETDTNIMIGYCWAAGGAGLLKKVALIGYSDYGYANDADGIEITTRGFKDTPAPVRSMLRAETEISLLRQELAELRKLIERDNPTDPSPQHKTENPYKVTNPVFKRRT